MLPSEAYQRVFITLHTNVRSHLRYGGSRSVVLTPLRFAAVLHCGAPGGPCVWRNPLTGYR